MSIYRNSRNFHRGKGNIRETEPYQGGNIDGKDTAPELGVSELDPRSQFSVLFISHKETRTKVPRSEIVEKCTDAALTHFTYCHLTIAYVKECDGAPLGGLDILKVLSRDIFKTLIPWHIYNNLPSALNDFAYDGADFAANRKTLSTRKVCNSVQQAEQHQFQMRFFREPKESSCATQARQCSLAFFPDSFFLNEFSSQVIVERASLSF
ncbi:hypothetical protein POTOM_051869 [Populus tomentosa]|uniref:Uncharacterized protein n=1 Tax=Populus tomentosa TaxID=118781 RepID=A0A8X8CA41_POPTO|nr:hypothetical protein POTOM_051869 [Populus tomentosa]